MKASPKPVQKNQTTAPMFAKNLGASPQKQTDKSAIDKGKLAASKVYIKRDHLYSELDHIPVTVEQSSCFQILEDFLRNRVKTMEQVKALRFDYGFGGRGPPGSMGKEQQSLTQKLMRKTLGKPAQKFLDSVDQRLIKILNNSSFYKLGQRPPRGGDEEEESDDEMKMEGIEKQPPKKDSQDGDKDKEGFEEKPLDDPFKDGSRSQSGDEGDLHEDQEAEEEERQAEIERQNQLDEYVESVADELVAADDIPEEQQHLLAKMLTR